MKIRKREKEEGVFSSFSFSFKERKLEMLNKDMGTLEFRGANAKKTLIFKEKEGYVIENVPENEDLDDIVSIEEFNIDEIDPILEAEEEENQPKIEKTQPKTEKTAEKREKRKEFMMESIPSLQTKKKNMGINAQKGPKNKEKPK